MAVKMPVSVLLFIVLTLFISVKCQEEYTPYVVPTDCQEGAVYAQYFSTSFMACRNCPEPKTSMSVQDEKTGKTGCSGISEQDSSLVPEERFPSGLNRGRSPLEDKTCIRCVCNAGYRYVRDFGNENIKCERCAANQVRSEDGYSCVACTNATCASCPAGRIGVERQQDGTPNNARTCLACTGTTTPNSAANRCVPCNNILSIITTATSCDCQEKQVGNLCFPNSVAVPTPEYTLPLTGFYVRRIQLIPGITALYAVKTCHQGEFLNDRYIKPLSNTAVRSIYLEENLQTDYLLCKNYNASQNCQSLSNMCVLSYYRYDSGVTLNTPCDLYTDIAQTVVGQWSSTTRTKPYLPWLYYFSSSLSIRDGDRVIGEDGLTTSYTFDPKSQFKFRVGRFTLNGTYLGISNVGSGLLQLCTDTTNKLDAAYTFGTYYSHTCTIPAIDLWDRTRYPLEFYDLYLEFTADGENQLYYIPIRFTDFEFTGDNVNAGSNAQDWYMTRRLFLVDNVASTGDSGTADQPQYVRYARNIEITVRLFDSLGNGRIYPPYWTVSYGEVSRADAEAGATISPTFTVKYSMSLSEYRRNFQIATGTLSTLGVIYAGYKTWVWSKRAGRLAIDFASIGNFIFFVSGVLSNVFFVITFGIGFYFLVFFKRQSTVYLFLLEGTAYEEWLGLFGAAFALKALQVIHMVVTQCMVDIFFIDWEKPKPGVSNKGDQKKENPVSIWRTYFVANEWNELQTSRKINQIFQIFGVVFFLNYVGFENVATKDPNGKVVKSDEDYQADQDPVLRYAIAALVYLLVAVVQWIFFTFVYERFVSDKVRDFVDLCAMSNISVFIMQHAQFGYYIHGRSVHGKADTDMREMCDMIKREEEDLCGKRGLEEDQEEQTFVMSLPRKLRLKYEEVLLPVALENIGGGGPGAAGGKKGGLTEKQVDAYNVINKFLSSFINHSLKSLDYVVKDKSLLENIMDTEFLDTSETGIFYKDNGHSFDQCLFYGNEITLLLFDLLLFVIVDHIAKNFVIAGVITYLIIGFVALIRDEGGKRNLAKKTLVDERFLI